MSTIHVIVKSDEDGSVIIKKGERVKASKEEKVASQMRRRQSDVKNGLRDGVLTKRQAERGRSYLRKIGALV